MVPRIENYNIFNTYMVQQIITIIPGQTTKVDMQLNKETRLGQRGPENNGNSGVLHILQLVLQHRMV